MLTNIFQTILLTSAVGGVLALVLLAIKPLTAKFFSPAWQYYIWLAVLLIMLLPLHLPIAHTPEPTPSQEETAAAETPAIPKDVVEGITADNGANITYSPAATDILPKQSASFISRLQNFIHSGRFTAFAAPLWLAGFLVIFSLRLLRYLILLLTIHHNSQTCPNADFAPRRLAIKKPLCWMHPC